MTSLTSRFLIGIVTSGTLDELNFIQKLLTPAHRWQKCARKTLGTHDWICKVALSSTVIIHDNSSWEGENDATYDLD